MIDVGSAQSLECGGVKATDHAVWILVEDGGEGKFGMLERLDLSTNTISARIKLPANVDQRFAVDDAGVWTFEPMTGLIRIDPRTNQVAGELVVDGAAGVAVGAGSVWLGVSVDGTVLRIAPTL